jgi:hypothetical protein
MKEKDWLIIALILGIGFMFYKNHTLGKKNDALAEKNKQLEMLRLKFNTQKPKITPAIQPKEKPKPVPPQPGPEDTNLGNPKPQFRSI